MDAPLAQVLFPVLGKYLGQPLTAEVASRLAAEILAQCYPGPIDTRTIGPQIIGSYVIRCAPVAETLSQLRTLHEQHWKETEGHRHAIAFNPDYERVTQLDLQGRVLLVVAEKLDTKEVVGNYLMYIATSAHTQTLMATEDTLFVSKAHRKGRLGVSMIRYMEHALKKLGVEELGVSVKLVNDVGQMLERMGYQPVGKQYTKILKEGRHVLT